MLSTRSCLDPPIHSATLSLHAVQLGCIAVLHGGELACTRECVKWETPGAERHVSLLLHRAPLRLTLPLTCCSSHSLTPTFFLRHQVKQEMKDGGATKSQFGASTVRSGSVMSSVSRAPSSVSRAPSSMSRSMSRTGRKKTDRRPDTASTRPGTAMSGGSSLTLGSDWGTNENQLGGGMKRVPGGMRTGLLPTNRGRNKLNLKVLAYLNRHMLILSSRFFFIWYLKPCCGVSQDNEKPIVPRPISKGAKCLPAPKAGAFKHAEFETSNQSEYKPLGAAGPRINQGPTRAPSGRNKEQYRMFSKECEAQVASSAITGSAVFGSRLTAQ